MKKISFVIYLLCTIVVSTSAQDVLITSKGDTLKGKISVFKSRQGVEQISIKINKKKQQFRLLDISEYYRKGVRYKTVFAEGRYRIGKVVSEGYLSLYYYTPTSYETIPDFSQKLLIKENGENIEVPKALLFRKTIAKFLADCPTVSRRISDKAYTRDQLDLIIRDYNSCIVAEKSSLEKKETLESKVLTLRAVLKESNKIENKADVRQMLNDLDKKIKAKEDFPEYLKTALTNALSPDLRLASLLLEIFDYN